MRSFTISPKVSFWEKFRYYREYVRKMRRTGHKPVSFYHFLAGRL